jgi:hypothetical protein
MSEPIPLFTSSLGVKHSMLRDDNGGLRFLAEQDTEAHIDRNKAMATHNDGYTPTREMRRVASIPAIVMLKWLNEEGWWALDPGAANKLAQKLNDPTWAYLRTAPGTVEYSNGAFR